MSSVIKGWFHTLLSISCLGASKTYKYNTGPAVIKYQKITDIKYNITISPYNNHSKYLFFEVNSYEHKAVQDTTVESATPQKNNAFGGVAFVGNSKIFGEQWLYSKIDFYTLRAPIKAGEKIGDIIYLKAGNEVIKGDIVAKDDVSQVKLITIYSRILNMWAKVGRD